VYDQMPLNGPDRLDGPEQTRVGAPCVDAPLTQGFLLDQFSGDFTVLCINANAPGLADVDGIPLHILCLKTDTDDPSGTLTHRYLGQSEQAIYLVRPDQHVAARWDTASADDISAALRISIGKGA